MLEKNRFSYRTQTERAASSRKGVCLTGATILFLLWTGLSTNASADEDEDPFNCVAPKAELKSGSEKKSPARIKAKPGWKWNKEYPATVNISVEGPCDANPTKLGKGGGKIEVDGSDAVLPITLKGKSSGKAKITLTANFSICNEETCRIFRKKVFTFPVRIK